MLEAILSAHSEAGTVVYGTEPIHAVGSRYHIRRSQLLKTLRTHGMVQAYFLEGLIHRLATKLSAPEWFLRHSALWAIPSPHLTPFSHYMQYVVRVTHV